MSDIELLISDLRVGNSRRKRQAMQQLEKFQWAAIPYLVDSIASAKAFDVHWTLDGIGYEEEETIRKYPDAFDLIEETVKYRCWYIPAATHLLIKFGEPAVAPLALLLHSDRPPIRALAAYALGKIGNQSVSAELLERLEMANPEKLDDPEELSQIIEALGKLRAIQAVDRLIQLLPFEKLTFDVAVALARIHDLRALEPLAQQFRRPSASAHAVGAALCTFGYASVELVLEVLADQNASHVHHLVIEVLGMLGDIRAIKPIIDVLTSTSSSKIEDIAVIALGKLKAQQALPYLVDIFKTIPDPNLQHHTLKAIAAIGGESAFKIFVDFIENGPFHLRYLSIIGLASIPNLENIQPLLSALQNADPRIRATAAIQLANMGDERAVEALKLACNDPDWQTGTWAAEALRRIEQKSGV